MNDDPCCYPGTNVLRNDLGIRDADQLEVAERVITRARMREPLQESAAITPEGYRAMHWHIFRDVYPWAGELRTVNLEKLVTPAKTVEFQPGHLVAVNMKRVFHELRDDGNLRGLDANAFSHRAAVYLEDLNRIHPFREGNGRAQRLYLEHLADQAGHTLKRSLIDRDRWIEGSIQSFGQPIDGNHEVMADLVRRALVGGRENDRADAGKKGLTRPARPRGRSR